MQVFVAGIYRIIPMESQVEDAGNHRILLSIKDLDDERRWEKQTW